jgi:predicted glutamine amidotransferase
MCRMVGWVSAEPRTLRELLGDSGVQRLRALATVHCHGWGAAWFEDGELVVHRSPLSAAEDDGFRGVADEVAATAAIVHLRMGTPGYGRGVRDNHPFADGSWAMIHNGAVAPASDIGKLIAAGSSRRPQGSTDSERWFLALRDEIDGGLPVAQAVPAVIERARSVGLHASSWNSLLLGPDALHVISHHDPALLPVDVKLWPDLYPENLVCWPPYFDLRVRERDGTWVVLSSGIVDDVGDWALLPNKSVLRLPRDRSASELVELTAVGTAC